MSDAKSALRVEKLVVRYGDGPAIIDGVTIDIAEREVVALIGASGAGKSTLLRSIQRLVEPESGEVFLDGVELTALPPRELRGARRRIGMIFQEHALVARQGLCGTAHRIPQRDPFRRHSSSGRDGWRTSHARLPADARRGADSRGRRDRPEVVRRRTPADDHGGLRRTSSAFGSLFDDHAAHRGRHGKPYLPGERRRCFASDDGCSGRRWIRRPILDQGHPFTPMGASPSTASTRASAG